MTAVTPEQHAAWDLLTSHLAPENAAIIAPLLPPELTNPQPVLPTEPGWYLAPVESSPSGVTAIELLRTGEWVDSTDSQYLRVSWVASHMPLIRLVPERPQITPEQIETACRANRADPPNSLATLSILSLVNGTDRD